MNPAIPPSSERTLLVWRGVWVLGVLLFLAIPGIYLWLPVDGASGDSGSFSPTGFQVKELIEVQANGLRPGDIITHMDGQTIEAWLQGARGKTERPAMGAVVYEVLREGQPLELQIQLSPVSIKNVMVRWGFQMLVVGCFFFIGSFIFWKRPHEPAARWQMLFNVLLALQYWIDGYNLQPATLLYGWPFWFHFTLENLSWFIAYAGLLMFAFSFPEPHVLLQRYPRLVPGIVLTAGLMVQSITYLQAESRATAIYSGSRISFIPVVVQLVVATGIAIHSAVVVRTPLARAQLKWILVGSSVPLVVAIGGYSLPVVLFGHPWVSREVSMFTSVLVPLSFGIAVLRYRIFDIELIINRGLVYGTLTALLGSLYLGLVSGHTRAAQVLIKSSNEVLIVFIATFIIALAFAPLRERVQELIDRTFFRTKLNYQRMLPELVSKLTTIILLDELTELLSSKIPQQLQITTASLLVLDHQGENLVVSTSMANETQSERDFYLPREHPLRKFLQRSKRPLIRSQQTQFPHEIGSFLTEQNIEVCIPLLIAQAPDQTLMVGLYNLGSKRSGETYSREEVRLLTLLGNQAAVSVENARLYREIANYTATLEHLIAARTHQLAEKSSYLDNILSRATEDAIVTTDLEYRITYFNPGAEKFYGISAEEAIGKLISAVRTVNPSDEAFERGLANLQEQGEHRYDTEIEINGEVRQISSRLAGIYDLAGNLMGYARFSRDITDRKVAEAARRQLTAWQEHQRLARDLHDSMTQSVSGMVLVAENALVLHQEARFDSMKRSLQILVNTAQQTLREMRLLLFELQLAPHEQIDLFEILATRLESVEHRLGIKTTLQIDGSADLPPDWQTEIFFIISEALNNTLKHSQADQVTIVLQGNMHDIDLEIRDNGCGFDPSQASGRGMGLANMAQRAESIDGRLTITAQMGKGTRIKLALKRMEGSSK